MNPALTLLRFGQDLGLIISKTKTIPRSVLGYFYEYVLSSQNPSSRLAYLQLNLIPTSGRPAPDETRLQRQRLLVGKTWCVWEVFSVFYADPSSRMIGNPEFDNAHTATPLAERRSGNLEFAVAGSCGTGRFHS